jgi:flagellar basal-body rod protein FlgB
MAFLTDNVTSALERAMDGVALRQRVSAQNIANVMTPGYQAQRVAFEGNLASALSSGQDASQAGLTVTDEGGPADVNGNNVDLATESASLTKSGLQYDALVQAMNYKLSILRAAVR